MTPGECSGDRIRVMDVGEVDPISFWKKGIRLIMPVPVLECLLQSSRLSVIQLKTSMVNRQYGSKSINRIISIMRKKHVFAGTGGSVCRYCEESTERLYVSGIW